MPKTHIEKLEVLVPRLVEEAHHLQEQNRQLSKEVKSLRTDLEKSEKEGKRLQGKVDKLSQLESVQKQLEKNQTQIRTKVEDLLEGIEKIGLAL